MTAVLAAGLGCGAVAGVAGVAAQPAHAAQKGQPVQPGHATLAGERSEARYLGMWNYDQPNRQTMTDEATITCPAGNTGCAENPPIVIPQIGYIVFSAGPDGVVIGHTDQGCTWRFAVEAGGLELNPASQYCFNHVIGSGYTITRWSVAVSGRHETEVIDAISHLPSGDYDFTLQDGRRTKVSERPGPAGRFTGRWSYDPANPDTGVNIETVQYTAPDGQVTVTHPAVTGQVAISGHDGLVTATTGDGCRWTLAARGNTAELWPALQTCRHDGTVTTRTFWSIASDGTQQVSIIAGTEPGGRNFLLANGSLTRERTR